MADPFVKRLAEARRGDETKLLTEWSDGQLQECNREGTAREVECEFEPSNQFRFFERMGQLGQKGYQVEMLYDFDVITHTSELGDVRSLLEQPPKSMNP